MKKADDNSFYFMFIFIFSAVGILLIAISIAVSLSYTSFKNDAIPCDGRIIDIVYGSSSERFHPVVEYWSQGRIHTKEIGYFSSSMEVGQTIALLVDESDPMDAKAADEGSFVTAVLAAIGASFLIIGTSFAFSLMAKRRKILRIKSSGMLLLADITGIAEDLDNRRNGQCALVISCSYEGSDGHIYLFHSRPSWCHSYDIDLKRKMPVYVNPDDPAEYYVDVAMFFSSDGSGNPIYCSR